MFKCDGIKTVIQMGTGRFGHSCFGHSTSSATLYKDVSAMVLCVIYNNIKKQTLTSFTDVTL
jgi:hypothetical protein